MLIFQSKDVNKHIIIKQVGNTTYALTVKRIMTKYGDYYLTQVVFVIQLKLSCYLTLSTISKIFIIFIFNI